MTTHLLSLPPNVIACARVISTLLITSLSPPIVTPQSTTRNLSFWSLRNILARAGATTTASTIASPAEYWSAFIHMGSDTDRCHARMCPECLTDFGRMGLAWEACLYFSLQCVGTAGKHFPSSTVVPGRVQGQRPEPLWTCGKTSLVPKLWRFC